jgi:hypothetical protein
MLANRTLDFCEMEQIVNHNVFLHSLLNHFLENLKFAIKCPFKKVKDVWENLKNLQEDR